MNNTVIKLKDGRYFGGWGKLGLMLFIPEVKLEQIEIYLSALLGIHCSKVI